MNILIGMGLTFLGILLTFWSLQNYRTMLGILKEHLPNRGIITTIRMWFVGTFVLSVGPSVFLLYVGIHLLQPNFVPTLMIIILGLAILLFLIAAKKFNIFSHGILVIGIGILGFNLSGFYGFFIGLLIGILANLIIEVISKLLTRGSRKSQTKSHHGK